MKPALVLQHLTADGPAYLATWLDARGWAFEVRNTEAGQAFPDRLDDYAAMAILGGEMSANDELPSLRRAEALIREAVARGLPVLGHCLGGQLMARALGAQVVASPRPEIGWQPMAVIAGERAAQWFGRGDRQTVFQWHYEAFELPPGAVRLAGSAACPNQAFAIGPHLAMQFHVEVDAEKLGRWSHDDGARYRAVLGQPEVQDGAAMRGGLDHALPCQQRLADRIYARWQAHAMAYSESR